MHMLRMYARKPNDRWLNNKLYGSLPSASYYSGLSLPLSGYVYFLFTFVFLFLPRSGAACSNGITGYSGKPSSGGQYCTECHSGNNISGLTVSGEASVARGTSLTYINTLQ